MTFDGEDFDALLRYLDAHPDTRDQLRRRILDEQFLTLPAEVRELRAEVRELASRLDLLTEDVRLLTVHVNGLTVQVTELALQMRDLALSVAEYVGPMYELLFRQKAPSLFGEWLRRPRVVEIDDVPGFDDLEAAGGFTAQELRRLRALDMVVSGADKAARPPGPLFLAVEISRTIDLEDVDRAIERAQLLARGGAKTRAAVAGKVITGRAKLRADETSTLVRLLDEVA